MRRAFRYRFHLVAEKAGLDGLQKGSPDDADADGFLLAEFFMSGFGWWCKGSTAAFGAVSGGSNPPRPEKQTHESLG